MPVPAEQTSWDGLFKRLTMVIGLGALAIAVHSAGRVHQRWEYAASVRIDRELGLTAQQVDQHLAADLDLPPGSSGLVITSLAEGRPADRAGLEAGDLVEQIGATAISDPISAAEALDKQRTEKLDLIVKRRGRDLRVALNRG